MLGRNFARFSNVWNIPINHTLQGVVSFQPLETGNAGRSIFSNPWKIRIR
jgi:hypothetical protein